MNDINSWLISLFLRKSKLQLTIYKDLAYEFAEYIVIIKQCHIYKKNKVSDLRADDIWNINGTCLVTNRVIAHHCIISLGKIISPESVDLE